MVVTLLKAAGGGGGCVGGGLEGGGGGLGTEGRGPVGGSQQRPKVYIERTKDIVSFITSCGNI